MREQDSAISTGLPQPVSDHFDAGLIRVLEFLERSSHYAILFLACVLRQVGRGRGATANHEHDLRGVERGLRGEIIVLWHRNILRSSGGNRVPQPGLSVQNSGRSFEAAQRQGSPFALFSGSILQFVSLLPLQSAGVTQKPGSAFPEINARFRAVGCRWGQDARAKVRDGALVG